jgi:hypothetical protein
MNIETGELIRLASLMPIDPEERGMFREVPDELAKEAKKELGDKDRVFVDMKKKTPLTKWAHQQGRAIHKTDKRKARRKIAKASKRRNR